MGSPLFGSIEVRGLKRRFDGRRFGEAMAFSPDSRWFAIAELIDTGSDGPISRAIVLQLALDREYIASPSVQGLINRLSWVAENTLSIVQWRHLYGETSVTWRAPKDA